MLESEAQRRIYYEGLVVPDNGTNHRLIKAAGLLWKDLIRAS